MASRSDIFVRRFISPRVIEVESPSVELLVQDLVDTARDLEYAWEGMSHPHLVNASGKEDLGGGVFVGITAQLQNAQIVFEGTPIQVSSATVTTASSTPVRRSIRLIASAATFITGGVIRGYVISNTTDESFAEVIDVISETELMVGVPISGTFNDFRIGDVITIHQVIKPVIRGGNLVAVDDVAMALESTVTAAFTQLIVEKASASTLLSADTNLLNNIEKLLRNKLITDPIAGTITLYADDGTTVLFSALLWEDAAGTIPYKGEGAERRDRLV